MLENVKYYANYIKQIVAYASKCIDLVVSTINNWPRWVPPIKKAENVDKGVQSTE